MSTLSFICMLTAVALAIFAASSEDPSNALVGAILSVTFAVLSAGDRK